MAAVMVNFRIDEEVKKNMEQACKEMGMSMTAAFTVFATKVGKEKRIPFEITAAPAPVSPVRRRSGELLEEADGLALRQVRLEGLCGQVRQSLTALHTAVPASITGLSMEHIRLLCQDELKDKAAGVSRACKDLFSPRNAGVLERKDLTILDEYGDSLSSIAEELRDLEDSLIPAMRACPAGEAGGFAPYERRLTEVSQRLDGLAPILGRFWASAACGTGARAVRTRIRQAAAPVETPYVRTALEGLDALVLRHQGALEGKTASRLEGEYLNVLERTLEELVQAEREGSGAAEKAALCLRAVNVLSQVISDAGQLQREWSQRSLEAEVEALERLAAMRGDIGGMGEA